MREADIIILGSPVYWANITGIMKSFFDRHTGYAMYNPKNADKFYKLTKWEKIKKLFESISNFGPKYEDFKYKRYILITAATVPFRYLMNEISPAINAMKRYVKKLNGSVVGKIIYTDTLFQFNSNKKRN